MRAALALRDGRLLDISILRASPLCELLTIFNRDGEEARLVGGAVRDLLLGEPPGDLDLATTATPQTVIARARAAGVAYAPTGIAHGTVTLISHGATVEVTTLREDIETDGRHAKVRFGRDFREDAQRRDFTINALMLDAEGRVHDYCRGLDDLAERRVRFIGDARQRIREDYLRILRFFRFSARFGDGSLEPAGFAAAIALREGLLGLSRERVRAELMKLLIARSAAKVIEAMADADLLGPLLAGIVEPARLARVIAIEIARSDLPDAVLRLAAAAVRVEDDADRLRERLKLSNAEHERLAAAARGLAGMHGREAPPGFGELRLLLFERGRQGSLDSLALAHAESGAAGDDARWLSAWRFCRDTPIPRLPFGGADIVARGVRPGRGVGAALKILQANWIRAGFPREPETLARLLEEAMRLAG